MSNIEISSWITAGTSATLLLLVLLWFWQWRVVVLYLQHRLEIINHDIRRLEEVVKGNDPEKSPEIIDAGRSMERDAQVLGPTGEM